MAITKGEYKAPSFIKPGLPKAIDEWMTKALATSPDKRFESVKHMADALSKASKQQSNPKTIPHNTKRSCRWGGTNCACTTAELAQQTVQSVFIGGRSIRPPLSDPWRLPTSTGLSGIILGFLTQDRSYRIWTVGEF